MSLYPFLSIPVGWLLGSIPSAYMVGRFLGKTDMRTEGDGHISAAAIYRRVGRLQYLLVVAMDIGKGALSIFIANLLTDSLILVLLTGFVTVIGHCWSVFLKFKGGLGATAICGVLVGTAFWPLVIGLAAAAMVMLTTRRSGLSSGIAIVVISIVLLIQYLVQGRQLDPVLIIYPFALILIMVLKNLQVQRRGEPMLEMQSNRGGL